MASFVVMVSANVMHEPAGGYTRAVTCSTALLNSRSPAGTAWTEEDALSLAQAALDDSFQADADMPKVTGIEADIDNRADDLSDRADIVAGCAGSHFSVFLLRPHCGRNEAISGGVLGGSRLLCRLLLPAMTAFDYSASAPEMISISSLVMTAWRVRL